MLHLPRFDADIAATGAGSRPADSRRKDDDGTSDHDRRRGGRLGSRLGGDGAGLRRIAASSTRCTATPTATWWPTRRAEKLLSRHAGLRLHAGRGSGDLRGHLGAVHRASGGGDGQGVQFFAVQSNSRRGRGDALGAAAHRRLLDRADALRGEPRRRGALRHHGLARTGASATRCRSIPERHDIQTMADLKGKRVAHTAPTSNSGNQAPRALFPALGVVPDKDYKVIYSGSHDQSMLGVVAGDYDAAPVASEVVERMAARKLYQSGRREVIWESQPFPTTSYTMRTIWSRRWPPRSRRRSSPSVQGHRAWQGVQGCQQIRPDHLQDRLGE